MMARIRSVHPGLWTDEAFVSVPPLARLLFIGLWTEADDHGVFEWKPIGLKLRLIPADDGAGLRCGTGGELVENLLLQLAEVGLIKRVSKDAKHMGLIKNFARWQRPKKPRFLFPIEKEWAEFIGLTDFCGEPVGNPFGTGGGNAPQMEEEGGRRKEIPPNPPSKKTRKKPADSPELVAFWEAYPLKRSKGRVRVALAKALAKAPATEIMAGLARAKWPSDPQYIPYPASWLNADGWLDEMGQAELTPERKAWTDHDYLKQAIGSGERPPSLVRAMLQHHPGALALFEAEQTELETRH